MVWLKRIAVLLLVYIGIVVAFETFIGVAQPQSDNTIVVMSASDGGEALNRVLTRLNHADKLYAAVNHWPRAWYGQVQEDPSVNIAIDGETLPHTAVDVTDPVEFAAIQNAHPLPFFARFLMGFPPRKFVRFDPVEA